MFMHCLTSVLTDYNWLITTTVETLMNDIYESRGGQTLDPHLRSVRQQLGLTFSHCYKYDVVLPNLI